MKHVKTFLVTLALFILSMSASWAQTPYIITKSGANFIVNGSGSYATIQSAIDFIKGNAYGAACTIQFGSGSVLDIVFAYGSKDEDIIFGDYTRSGDAIIAAWNKAAGTATYTAGTNDDIYKIPATGKIIKKIIKKD
jgi:hypothetical protein